MESALLRMERRGLGATPERARVIRDAFAHRRKSLARSLELARPGALVPARAALAAMERPEDAGQALAPQELSEASRRCLEEAWA